MKVALPTLEPAARYGWIGEILDTIGPQTEACDAALALQALAFFGNACNSSPYFPIGGARHGALINALLYGPAASGRKGQSKAEIVAVFKYVDADWCSARMMSGLASGEGLIAAVRDPEGDDDQGVADKRLCVVEPEFSRPMRVAARDGSTLSEVLRECFDTGNLRVMTRRNPLVATGAHISVTGHITAPEFRARTTDLDAENGFLTRFVIAEVGRTQLLPNGGSLAEEDFARLGRAGRDALVEARKVGRMHRTPAADALWAELYRTIHTENRPEVGMRFAVMARADTLLLRLSMVYALTDGSSEITSDHLEAAWAILTYSDESVSRLFGSLTGNRIADRIYTHLPNDPMKGLSATEQRDLFDRHASGDQLEEARALLEELGLAENRKMPTGGRSRLLTFRNGDGSDVSDGSLFRDDLWSLRALRSQAEKRRGASNGHGPVAGLAPVPAEVA